MLLHPVIALAASLLVGCGPQDNGTKVPERALVPAPTALAAAPATLPAAGQDEPTTDRTNQTGAAVLRTILLKVGEIDGQRITDF
jgi:hypothetical protein